MPKQLTLNLTPAQCQFPAYPSVVDAHEAIVHVVRRDPRQSERFKGCVPLKTNEERVFFASLLPLAVFALVPLHAERQRPRDRKGVRPLPFFHFIGVFKVGQQHLSFILLKRR